MYREKYNKCDQIYRLLTVFSPVKQVNLSPIKKQSEQNRFITLDSGWSALVFFFFLDFFLKVYSAEMNKHFMAGSNFPWSSVRLQVLISFITLTQVIRPLGKLEKECLVLQHSLLPSPNSSCVACKMKKQHKWQHVTLLKNYILVTASRI